MFGASETAMEGLEMEVLGLEVGGIVLSAIADTSVSAELAVGRGEYCDGSTLSELFARIDIDGSIGEGGTNGNWSR